VAQNWLSQISEIYTSVARRQWLACAVVGLLCLGGRAALLPRWHVPQPAVHDEFSYSLAAETYASGRLTNPPHPLWEHFETFHELQQPTYMSKYPPLQGLMMALGLRLLGQPWWGVWLSAGLMCAAVCWMLQGWIAPGWALLGGLMVVANFGISNYWMNSYWGGAIAATGGALVLGAAPRIARQRRVRDAVAFAAGLSVLMNSRPFEGFVLALLASFALGCWLYAERAGWAVVGVRLVLPAGLVLAAACAAMAYQNWRVTGDPLLLPYVAHDRQYAAVSLFVWKDPPPEPVYRHAALRRYWVGWQGGQRQQVVQDIVGEFFRRVGSIYGFLFGFWPILAMALIWPFTLKTREERWTVGILVVFLLCTLMPLLGYLPHYGAPITALLYLRLLQGFSRLPNWSPSGRPFGMLLLAGLLAAWFIRGGVDLTQPDQVPQFAWDRAQVIRQIEKTPGKHVVLVRYRPEHRIHDEWVYNSADIDRSPIVWAREMGPSADAPLVDYYHDRHIWLLEADASPAKLEPYSGGAALPTTSASRMSR
jgi:hypothetical protein